VSRKRTIGIGLCLGILTLPGLAMGNTFDDPVRVFATCAGRLSAQMEHQWLLSDPASDQTEHQRDIVLEVLAAMTPEGQESRIMGWRLEAKVAHAALLQSATFRNSPWAGETATRLVAQCTTLVVS